MAGDIVKIRLRASNREIDIEASRTDVDELLDKWWSQQIEEISQRNGDEPDGQDSSNKVKPKARRRAQTSKANGGQFIPRETNPSLDPHVIANMVKEHENFEIFERKIIHQPGERYNKIAFIAWFVNKPLTSGHIQRSLQALNIKIDLPSVSNIIKKNINNFGTNSARKTGGSPAEYWLTAKARADFEKWLLSNGQ